MFWINRLLYSPSLLVSRFQRIMGHQYWTGSKRTRVLLAEETARRLAGIASLYTLATLAGCSVDLNPLSGAFAKIKLPGKDKDGKDTYLDPMGGLAQALTVISRAATGKNKTGAGAIVKTRRPFHLLNQTPEVTKSEATGFAVQNPLEIVGRFLRSKLAPGPGAVVDVLAGEDFLGDPVTAQSIAQKMVTPMAWSDVWALLSKRDLPSGTIAALFTMLGTNMTSYGADAPNSQGKPMSTNVGGGMRGFKSIGGKKVKRIGK